MSASDNHCNINKESKVLISKGLFNYINLETENQFSSNISLQKQPIFKQCSESSCLRVNIGNFKTKSILFKISNSVIKKIKENRKTDYFRLRMYSNNFSFALSNCGIFNRKQAEKSRSTNHISFKHCNSIDLIVKELSNMNELMIKRGNYQKIQIQEKQTKKILELIDTSKQKLSLIDINKKIKLYLNYILSQNKDLLLGGGGCCSKQEINESNFNTIKIIDENTNNNNQNTEFENEYKKWTDQKTINQTIQTDKQLKTQMILLKKCIADLIPFDDQINIHKSEIQDIFETYLILEITRVSDKSDFKQQEFEKILQEVKYIESYEQDFPIMQLVFYVNILINLNKLNHRFDESQKKIIIQAKELAQRFFNFNKNGDISAMISNANAIKQNIHIFNKEKDLFSLIFQIETMIQKIEQFGDKIFHIREEEEILFYVNFFFKIKDDLNKQEQVILILIRVHYILEKFLKEKSQDHRRMERYQQLSNALINANIYDFLNELMQKQDNFNNDLFLVFSIENLYYRYVTLSILLLINSIFTIAFKDTQNLISQNQEYLIEFLCNKYLTEQELAIRVIFERSHEFVKFFNENIKNESFKQKMIEFDKQRKEKLQPHVKQLQNHERSISSFDDIIKLISDNAIQKWERDIKKRQRSNIAQKDDVLLEVRDLYINQMITYLKGNPIFQKSKQDDNLENEPSNQQQNALHDILKLFLNPDYSYRLKQVNDKLGENQDENQFKQQSNQCQILSILAEGGTGKSMFIKKLETLLIEKLTKLNNNETETGNYLPILVKCNSLDRKNPSLDEYLKQQGINEDMLQSLKQNDRNKLILFDGYDEYTGDYFMVYSTLKLNEWKNTKIIISSRKEKLSEKDASLYFSKQNELGLIDEMSYSLVRLEQFTLKDIHEYADRYFRQERKTDQLNLIETDLKNMRDCLTNIELEKLLQLPINLYLFTRMIVNLNDKEIQNLKSKVSDQIGIQEIFFSDQFEREAQSFIDAYIDSINLKRDKTFRISLKDCYFEYFQTIAMLMFKNRGVIQGNYLQIEKQYINFNIPQSLTEILQKPQAISLLDKIRNYINSKIITRVKQEQQQQINQPTQNQQQFVEFKHKSLFEYFVARSMKSDFDIHEENIYKLKIEELAQFKINQKSIMNNGENQSEQQILIKLYKLIKNQIECEDFSQNYHLDQIEKNNRYIQYIKKSNVQTCTDISQIDIGSSNMISTLFVSKFSYSKLSLSLCSFSKAYISTPKSREINFDRCNLNNAFLQGSQINFDSCNTQSACIDAFSKVFDFNDIYSFNKVLWDKNNHLYSISESGFINMFNITNQGYQLLKQKQISQSDLRDIQFLNDNYLLVSSLYTLFLINVKSFEVQQTHKFANAVSSISLIEEDIVVVFKNQTIFKGTFQDGFKQLDSIQTVIGSVYDQIHQILITYSYKSFSAWNVKKNFEAIKTIEAHWDIRSVSFSKDGQYLATAAFDKTCNIWNAQKEFELIKSITEHTEAILSVTFSADGMYLATGSWDNTCKIWNAKKGFELINTIEGHTDAIGFVIFSSDGNYLATCSSNKICKIWNAQKDFQLINAIQEHTGYIYSAAFSVDGKYLATGSQDKSCKIWNVQKGFELIKTIQEHTSEINSVIFSRDGKYLVTGSKDQTCKIWNVEKEFELINSIYEDYSNIQTVALSSDGKYLVTSLMNYTCKIWNAERDFELITRIHGHTFDVNTVVFSLDGKYLVTGSSDLTFRIWSVEGGFGLIKQIQGHRDHINSVAFSVDGKYLATGSSDKLCKIWNAQKGFELINTIKGHADKILSVAFSADRKLATGSQDKTCKIWDAEKNFELINTIKGHTSYINFVAFSIDGRYLATISRDYTFKIWNVMKRFELINEIQGHIDSIVSVSFSEDGKYLATVSYDKTCKIWNAEKTFELMYTIQGHSDCITCVNFSADGKYLVTGSSDRTYKIWNVMKGFELTNTIQAHFLDIKFVSFSKDGKYLITTSLDKTYKIWNVQKNFEHINTNQEHTDWISSVAFSNDGKHLATGSLDKTCKIWNVEKSFELINTIQGHTGYIKSVAFSADGKYLATGSSDKSCKIWNVVKDFELINTIQELTEGMISVNFSVDGKYLATSLTNKTCKLWNVQKSFELINTIQGHNDLILSVAFSSDGKYLATSSIDQTCKIWNLEKGFKLINQFQQPTGNINSVVFSEDGKYLATGSFDKTYKIWNVEKGLQLRLTISQISKVVFSRDNKYILVEQNDQKCKIYDLSTFQIIDELGQNNYETVKDKYQFQQIQNRENQKINLFEYLYVL